MIDTLVFDIGMVLIYHEPRKNYVPMGFSKEAIEKLCSIPQDAEFLIGMDRGTVSEKQIMCMFKLLAGKYSAEAEYAFYHSHEYIRPVAENIDFMRRAKEAGYKIYLLSNFSFRNWGYTKRDMGFYQYVDGAVVSCYTGYVKPEPMIYEILLKRYAFKPQNCLFIDDRRENTLAAERIGFHTITLDEPTSLTSQAKAMGIVI